MRLISQVLLVVFATAFHVFADYEVDVDLGTLPEGSTEVSGTTALVIELGPPEVVTGGRNNADLIIGEGVDLNPAGNWGNEYVMQFSLAAPSSLTISKDVEFAAGDPDFFLLEGLTTEFDDSLGKNVAQEGIWYNFFDEPAPVSGTVSLRAGTYYLVAESFTGFDGAVNQVEADFSLNISVLPALFPDEVKVNLGFVGVEGSPLTFDTFGSDFDTQLAVFSFDGSLVQQNDNAGGTATFEIVEGSFSWDEARADAEARGGRLAVLDTQAQLDAAYSYLEEVGSWPFLWLGASDAETEDVWVWLNGAPLEASNPRWKGEEGPANINNNPDAEDYLVMFSSDSGANAGLWGDAGNRQAYLLETGNQQSEVSFPDGLAAGTYIAVVAGAGATFEVGPLTTAGGAVGNVVFNYPSNPNLGAGAGTVTTTTSEGTEVSETIWYEFTIASGRAVESVDLGKIAEPGVPFQLNTLEGTVFDTQLAVYDGFGYFLYFNDDANGTLQSLIDLPDGLEEGVYYVVVTAYPTTFADGFEISPGGTTGGSYTLTHPNGLESGIVENGTPNWYRFVVGDPANGGGGNGGPRSDIEITSLTFDPGTNQFTVAWESSVPGPFLIEMGTAADLAAITREDNILPDVAAVGLETSPVTVAVPFNLLGEPKVFLRVMQE